MKMPAWRKPHAPQPGPGRNPAHAASPASHSITKEPAMKSSDARPQPPRHPSRPSSDAIGLPGDARFSADRMRELQQDTLGPREKERLLRERDHAGLNLGQWALAGAVSQGANATMMLRELTQPTPVESGKLDAGLTLLEAIAQTVIRIERRQMLLESVVARRA